MILAASANGTSITYTTDSKGHSFAVGDVVNISGFTPNSLNLQGAVVATTPSTSSFTVLNSLAAVSSTNGGGYAIDLTPTYTFTNTLVPAVQAYMAPTIPAGVTLTIAPPTYVPVYLTIAVVASPAYRNADVKLAVYQAMLGNGGYFQYSNNTFGDTLYPSAIISAISQISGVVSTTLTQFNIDGTSSSSTVGIPLTANQIPFLTNVSLQITVSGGLSS